MQKELLSTVDVSVIGEEISHETATDFVKLMADGQLR